MRGTLINCTEETSTLEFPNGTQLNIPTHELPRGAHAVGKQVEVGFLPIGDAVSASEARDVLNYLLGATDVRA